jgi:hypothetical protein
LDRRVAGGAKRNEARVPNGRVIYMWSARAGSSGVGPDDPTGDNPIDELGEIWLFDLIGNYASHLKAIPHPLINIGDLVARIDWVDCNIARCIKLAEAALQHPGNLSSSTQHFSKIAHHPIACTADQHSSDTTSITPGF